MASLNEVTSAVTDFFSRISGNPGPSHYEIGIRDSQDKLFVKNAEWAHNAGIYLFFKEAELKYVGRALITTGLARRVFEQATAFDDPKWDDVIRNPTSKVHIFALTSVESYWAPSLELFLTQRFRASLVNKRLS